MSAVNHDNIYLLLYIFMYFLLYTLENSVALFTKKIKLTKLTFKHKLLSLHFHTEMVKIILKIVKTK